MFGFFLLFFNLLSYSYDGDAQETVECLAGGELIQNEDGTTSCQRSLNDQGFDLSPEHMRCFQQCLGSQQAKPVKILQGEEVVAKKPSNLTQKDLKYLEESLNSLQVNASHVQYLLGVAYMPYEVVKDFWFFDYLFLSEKASLISGEKTGTNLFATDVKKSRKFLIKSAYMGHYGAQKMLIYLYNFEAYKTKSLLELDSKTLAINSQIWMRVNYQSYSHTLSHLITSTFKSFFLQSDFDIKSKDIKKADRTVDTILQSIKNNQLKNPEQANYIQKSLYRQDLFIVPKSEDPDQTSLLNLPQNKKIAMQMALGQALIAQAQKSLNSQKVKRSSASQKVKRSSASQEAQISWFKKLWNKIFNK